MDMMTRRRAMMAGIALPEWDIEWYGTDGVLPTAIGFTKTTNGTVTETLQTMSVKIVPKGSSSWLRYNYDSNAVVGVIEAEIAIWSKNGYYILRFGNGTEELSARIQYSDNYKGIYLRDATTLASMTKLATISMETRYVVKMVLRSSDADIYLDGTPIATGIDLSTMAYQTNYKGIAYQATGSSQTQGNIYTLKLKLGRTS